MVEKGERKSRGKGRREKRRRREGGRWQRRRMKIIAHTFI